MAESGQGVWRLVVSTLSKGQGRKLGVQGKGRLVLESGEAFQFRQPRVFYLVNFGPENDDIRAKNGYLVWVAGRTKQNMRHKAHGARRFTSLGFAVICCNR